MTSEKGEASSLGFRLAVVALFLGYLAAAFYFAMNADAPLPQLAPDPGIEVDGDV